MSVTSFFNYEIMTIHNWPHIGPVHKQNIPENLDKKFSQYLVVFQPGPFPAHWFPLKIENLRGKWRKNEIFRKSWYWKKMI